MDVRKRRMLAGIGLFATTAASAALFAAPAQAATTGRAEVVGTHQSIVKFVAGAGQANSLVITISGRTVTLDDRVAIKPGKGCKTVGHDRTKVRCVTGRTPTEFSIELGSRNDRVQNKTRIPMVAEGGTGNDTLIGGSGRDRLFGDAGNDRLYGNGSTDAIEGGYGNDVIYGGNGDDWLSGLEGNDYIHGGNGDDYLTGGRGADRLYGDAGRDTIVN